MLRDLTEEEQDKVEKALLKAFPDRSFFEHMLKLKLGFSLKDYIDTANGNIIVYSKIVEQAKDGWLDKLLLAALDYRKDSFALRDIVRELAIVEPERIAPQNLPVIADQNKGQFEKILNKRAPFLKYRDFIARFNEIGARICRIEIPKGTPKGTGWLVSPSLILTAYHVIKEVDESLNGLNSGDVKCRFDFLIDNNSNSEVGKVIDLADNWLIDKSKYSEADLTGQKPDPTTEELDYALIQLKEDVGYETSQNGVKRGWIEVLENAPVMSKDDMMIVAQHPMGRELEITFGEVEKYNDNATRIRYNNNTEGGSSGSPCFDISLTPFGLHHAAGPADNLPYNQCVPLRQVIKLMKSRSVKPFWTPA